MIHHVIVGDFSPAQIVEALRTRKRDSMRYEKNWWRSKKVLVALVTFLVIAAKAAFPDAPVLANFDEAKLIGWIVTAVGYLLAQGHVDAQVRSAALIAEAGRPVPPKAEGA